ncbi:hypothetical protein [Vibrio parahaemolyticus]|uniref:hypothetical protein n=1 Tax=Vibrio parahaemolyticus TaxID=670 RepID=UPI0005F1DDD3|nr:hypothetical protein [Vibrio parahaemolyticus]KJR15227.1 hypothetical protein UF28_16300 [Vibrio parahaemolyticus]
MNPLLFLTSLKDVIPSWLMTTLVIIALGVSTLFYWKDGDLSKLQGLFEQKKQDFVLTLPKKDLDYILLDTQGTQVGVWSNSYYVPTSATLTSETRVSGSNYPNINRIKIKHSDTKEQSFAHWSSLCYSGKPEVEELFNSGIDYIISCPIVVGDNVEQLMLGGFLQIEYENKPQDVPKMLGKVSHYTKNYKFD